MRRTEWKNKETTVVPGLAPSINAIMMKIRAGIPADVPTRTLETYYKANDLYDEQQIIEQYKEKLAKVQQSNEQVERMKKRAIEEQKTKMAQFELFLKNQESAQSQS